MSRMILPILLLAIPLSGIPAHAQGLPDPPSQETAVEFVVGDSGGVAPRKGTAWKVHYARGLHKGLYITGAWFKRDLAEDWIKVLHDARCAELFVPYHQSEYTRFFDMTGFSFPMAEVKEEDAGTNGVILPPFQGDRYPTVIREVRDRGVVWKDYANGVRRGREMVLWGGLQAGNYMYLMQYGFQDDGTITFRVGATGQNLPGSRQEAHMHNAYWRVDIDLFDGARNNAMMMSHKEDPRGLLAEDDKQPFNSGLEGGIDWEPKEFTMLRVECEKTNANGKNIAYDLMPLRMGTRGTRSRSRSTTSGSRARTPSGRRRCSTPTCRRSSATSSRSRGPTSSSGSPRPRTTSLATRTARATAPGGSGSGTTAGRARPW